jgi:hypothetical protein
MATPLEFRQLLLHPNTHGDLLAIDILEDVQRVKLRSYRCSVVECRHCRVVKRVVAWRAESWLPQSLLHIVMHVFSGLAE